MIQIFYKIECGLIIIIIIFTSTVIIIFIIIAAVGNARRGESDRHPISVTLFHKSNPYRERKREIIVEEKKGLAGLDN